MKITKDYLKRVIKEELEKELKASPANEKSEFVDKIEELQGVLATKHTLDNGEEVTLDEATTGTDNPDYDDYDDAWENYGKVRSAVLADPDYKDLENYFVDLKVKTERDKILTISRLGLPEGERGYGANSAVYLILSDPNDLTKKGRPREVDSIMVSEDYQTAESQVKEVIGKGK